MPIYTYKCDACGNVTEKRQSFSDAPLTTCEACSGSLRKLIHPAGIVFKGSGFYNTDYRNTNGAAKPSEPKTEPATSASSDTAKPATESSSKSDSSASTPAKSETATAAAASA